MDSLEVRPPSMAEKEKKGDLPQSQSSPLSLPKPGSQERLLAERKLVRKLDTRVLPTIFIIYIMNYIDACSLSHYHLRQSKLTVLP